MVEILQASTLALYEVKAKFNLRQVDDLEFFPEWQGELPELTDYEKEACDRSRADFLSLLDYPLHEEVVKLTILAPLLSLAGLLRYPFYPQAEAEIRLEVPDQEEVVRGKVDVRILRDRLWAVVIESKNKHFSLDLAYPQALLYMMSTPLDQPVYGLVTNGSHFRFIKLVRQPSPQYALSDEITIVNRNNGLYTVLALLKHLAAVVETAENL